MADNTTPTKLDPSAPSFTMPDSKENTPITNGTTPTDSKKPERPVDKGARTTTAENVAEAGAGVKLTGAQLKKQKADEKAARRAEKVAAKGAEVQAQQSQQVQSPVSAGGKPQRRPSVGSKKESSEPSHHKRTGSQSKALPIRPPNTPVMPPAPVKEEKKLNMVSHLRSKDEKTVLASAGREIHPAVLSLSLQLRDYVICGANARCVSMLLAFKKVIQSYITPPGVALSRHLTTHLGHQISYINHARPLGVSQGNAIRWLKKLIAAIDPDLAEGNAKTFLSAAIDQFIREKITLADEVIARDAGQRIQDGDTIITYGKSSVVERTLLTAHKKGKTFSVIVADSRPMYEGKNLARSLIRAGIDTNYCLLSALGDVVEDATKCMLGAASMLGNGRLSARAGTAMVAMMVKESTKRKVPVMVLCESIKFTGKVALDSMMMNELGETEALVEVEELRTITTPAPPVAAPAKGGKKANKEEEVAEKPKRGLEGWQDQRGLYLLSLMYDVTPAEYLDIVVSELGSLPPSAVPEVNRLHGGEE